MRVDLAIWLGIELGTGIDMALGMKLGTWMGMGLSMKLNMRLDMGTEYGWSGVVFGHEPEASDEHGQGEGHGLSIGPKMEHFGVGCCRRIATLEGGHGAEHEAKSEEKLRINTRQRLGTYGFMTSIYIIR